MPKHHRTIGDAVGYAMAHNARLAAQHDAARQATGIDTASDTAQHPGALRGLLEHVRIDTTGRDITVDGKVVAAARQATGQADTEPDPTAADDPTPLRWGHGDVLHGDDDTVTVCLSGPDRKPYWLELDPERAQALRDDLAPPTDTEPGACSNCDGIDPDTCLTHPRPTRDELRQRIARAIHRYDNQNALSGNDIPSVHHYGEADAVLAVLPAPVVGQPAATPADEAESYQDAARRAHRRLDAVERLISGRPGYHQITVKELLTAMSETVEDETR